MAFNERFVEANGYRIRYLEAGAGDALVVLHGAGGLRVSGAHELLAEHRRVILFEAPGFGESAENTRSQSMQDLAETMAEAAIALGLDRFDLMGNSFGGKLALWLAVLRPELVRALVLVAPAAIRPDGARPPRPEQRAELLYAHPERQKPRPPASEEVEAKQERLVGRLMGPPRDEELEGRMAGLKVPVLVLFGTRDRLIPADMGRIYKEILPDCHLVLVYDAGHAIDGDRPEAFTAVVDDFLNRHAGFLVPSRPALLHP
jgi:pimeloyl-ACP methyl ester carboxylesterase